MLILSLKCASAYLVGEWVDDVVDLGVDRVGDGGDEGEEPERRDDLARPPQPGHRVRVQRVADRQVPGRTQFNHHFPIKWDFMLQLNSSFKV